MNRAEHLRWAKDRALVYVDAGQTLTAFSSLASDLDKHPETAGHAAAELGMLQLLSGQLSSPREMREFIEGCN